MRWTDSFDIAIELEEKYPDVDILALRFTELRRYILELENFDDGQDRCNEKILEAIQMAWLSERS